MDQLHDLALGVAQRILAAGTEAEHCHCGTSVVALTLGVEAEDCSSGEDLMELAVQVLMEGRSRTGCKPEQVKSSQPGSLIPQLAGHESRRDGRSARTPCAAP